MSANHHTPYPAGTRFRPSEMNAPLAELDEAITANAAAIAVNAGDIGTLETAVGALPTFGTMAGMNYWVGTADEYAALGTYDLTGTFYFIIEEVSS